MSRPISTPSHRGPKRKRRITIRNGAEAPDEARNIRHNILKSMPRDEAMSCQVRGPLGLAFGGSRWGRTRNLGEGRREARAVDDEPEIEPEEEWEERERGQHRTQVRALRPMDEQRLGPSMKRNWEAKMRKNSGIAMKMERGKVIMRVNGQRKRCAQMISGETKLESATGSTNDLDEDNTGNAMRGTE
ncbi:hypothetical protein DFH09DRAFT_1093452 [Mycena vulgaris]|nr:hypothetical protein DFH09DRAFT_1093452 [Mycena vulgaris]